MKTKNRPALLACTLLLLAGCPDDDTSPEDTGPEGGDSLDLEACDVPRPCGDDLIETNLGEMSDDYRCLLESLLAATQDAAPAGVLLLQADWGDTIEYTDVALGYDDGSVLLDVFVQQNMSDDTDRPIERCMLRDAGFYQDCIDNTDKIEFKVSCEGVQALVTDCAVVSDPECPAL